jgi:hypothetical protein
MQSLFLRSVALVQFYRWYSDEITNSSAYAGMTMLSTRCGGRRPKSAEARSRGNFTVSLVRLVPSAGPKSAVGRAKC